MSDATQSWVDRCNDVLNDVTQAEDWAWAKEVLRLSNDRAALVALVNELTERVLHGIFMHDGSCRECGHQLAAEAAPHDDDCDVGKLLARARAVEP